MFRLADQEVIRRDVAVIDIRFSPAHQSIGRMLGRLGYSESAAVFSKALGPVRAANPALAIARLPAGVTHVRSTPAGALASWSCPGLGGEHQ